MNCAEIQDSLVEYLLNELSVTQIAAIEDHLANECPECQRELRELSESMGMLWKLLPSQPISASLREQILTKCLAEPCRSHLQPNVVATDYVSQHKSRIHSWREPLMALVAGALVMVAWRVVSTKPTETQINVAVAAPTTQSNQSNAGSFGTQQTPGSLEMLSPRYKKTQFVSLHRSTKEHEISGQLLWDRLNREVHVYCFGLSAPPTGWQYSVWLIGPNQSLRILDELKVDLSGECRAVAPWPLGDFQFIQVALSRHADLDQLSSKEVVLTSNALQSGGL